MYPAISSASATLLLLLVSALMVLSGTAKKRLVHRDEICPTCHHTRSRCTCRLL